MVKLVAESSAIGIINHEENMKDKILGIGELSKASGISISSLTRYRYLKQIKPVSKMGGRFFYDECTLETVKHLYFGGRKTPEVE